MNPNLVDVAPPHGGRIEIIRINEKDFLFLNYPSGDGDIESAVAWAQEIGLEQSTPEQKSEIQRSGLNFCEIFGVGLPLYLFSTTPNNDGTCSGFTIVNLALPYPLFVHATLNIDPTKTFFIFCK